MAHPYVGMPARQFWKKSVIGRPTEALEGLYIKRFEIGPADKIATAGSCFAQHIARRMRSSGYSVIDVEPAPKGMSDETKAKYGYGLYSARYANIYTLRQMAQLLEEAASGKLHPDFAWKRHAGGWVDAQRTLVEPMGLDSVDEVKAHREYHLKAVRKMLSTVDVFIFTMGLTEGWVHREHGTIYPMGPETSKAGTYDPAAYCFVNLGFEENLREFTKVRDVVKSFRPNARFILTVSPVPLEATASNDHVLVATMRSKSILRAVAAEAVSRFDDVDYFPSYEIIASPISGGRFYAEDMRNVLPAGVDTVMKVFFAEHPPFSVIDGSKNHNHNVVCEETLLGAFS